MDPDNNKVREINTRIMLCVNQAIEEMRDEGLTDNEVLFCLKVLLGKDVPSLDYPEFRRLQNILYESNLTYYANNPASMMRAAIITNEDKRRAKEQFVLCVQRDIDRLVKSDVNLGDNSASESSAIDAGEAFAVASEIQADVKRHGNKPIVEVKVDTNNVFKNNKGKRRVQEAPSSAPSIVTSQASHAVSPQVRSDNSSSDLADIKIPANTSQSQKVSESRISRFFGRVKSSVVSKPPIMINCTAVHEREHGSSALLQMIALNRPVENTPPTNDDIFVQGDISVGSKRYKLCIKDYIHSAYYSNDKIEAALIDAQITLMIFDLTSVKSFKYITKHASEDIDRYNLYAPKILLGTKKSLDDRAAVNRAEIDQVAKDIQAVYFECSPASDMQTIREQIVRSYLTIPERYLHRSHHVEVPAQSEGSEQMRNATKISCSTAHETGAGSSSLFRQIADRRFTNQSECTIGCDFIRRKFHFDNEVFDVFFVDVCNMQFGHNLVETAYKKLEVTVVLLLFDLSRRNTFETIDELFVKVKKINAAIRLILVGTKSDLVDGRQVAREEAEAAATRLNIPYFECSAKDAVNMENICAQIIREYRLFVPENDGCMPQLENRPT